MRVGDMVAISHKTCEIAPPYFGILTLRPSWGIFSVVCSRDGKKRHFDPEEWNIEVISENR